MPFNTTRRRWLKGSFGVLLGSAVAGCTSSDELGASEEAESSEDDQEEVVSQEILYDTIVEDRLREQHEFTSGDVLHVEASVNHAGRGVFTRNIKPEDNLEDDLQKTYVVDSKSFSQEIEDVGTHIVNAIAGGGTDGRMELLVKLERAGD